MISFVSGVYDIDAIPPHQNKEYDLTELPISAESELELEEKLDIIFNLSGNEKQKYEHYVHKIGTCRGERKTLDRIAAEPEFTQARNNFIYEHLDGTPDRFIKGIIGKYYDTLKGCEGLTYTDLIQEGWIGLILASRKYDKKRDVKFSTFAHPRVNGRIIRILTNEIKTNQAEGSYDKQKFESSIEKEAFAIHKIEQLSEQKQKILELYAEGYTQEEIAERKDLSQQRISQVLQAIKIQTSKNAPNS